MKPVFLLLALWIAAPCSAQSRVSIAVVDADSNKPIPARLYLTAEDGTAHFFQSESNEGTAFKYEKQNWINQRSTEYHTTISAHRCSAKVPPGTYNLIVERGKTYFPHQQIIKVSDQDLMVPPIQLKRWFDAAKLGWYSGDTHIHRELAELRNVVMAEDLNVVFPLTNWVTISDTPPSAGDKNLDADLPNELIRVDDQHVIWPRSTEYEIFTTNQQRHTLGALFVLGHQGPLEQTVPPWKPVIDAARAADPTVLFDMDKLAWPFAMTLPVIAPDATYELANNHMWRTDFAFRKWYTPTPSYMAPPFGDVEGGESQWIDFTLGMYYTLLNCGFRMPPSAGTANGVHPVPAGFGRVYVHLPDGFNYQQWKKGLHQGRSFVTTGPMLLATADHKHSGHVFKSGSDEPLEIPVHLEVTSEHPISFAEILINGSPEQLLRVRSKKTEAGAYHAVIDHTITPTRSGWFAVRCFEDRPGGRVRFAHTAPWYVEMDEQPVQISRDERDYLVSRMTNEIQRSRGVVSEAGIAEYEQALEFYRALPVFDDADDVARVGRPLDEPTKQRWLRNMIVDHRLTPSELRSATGMSVEQAQKAVNQIAPVSKTSAKPKLRIMPYPGGRHPRLGFLDGAIDPQRETKISVFPPWQDAGYAVIDVPEAIFSNLGLTYLAHTHVPTLWSEQSIELDRLEWKDTNIGFSIERKLPNDISFGSRVQILGDAVAMEMWLTNGTDQPLSGLRSQVCVMLKGMREFNSRRKHEHLIDGPFIAIRSDRANRWVITAWTPNNRAWDNPPVPCIHSDPIFPDCRPGETVKVKGGLWFYEGDNINEEIAKLRTQLP
ncbi:MAG: CehA/McbA family metallohydrolase [Rubripirellula sp.]